MFTASTIASSECGTSVGDIIALQSFWLYRPTASCRRIPTHASQRANPSRRPSPERTTNPHAYRGFGTQLWRRRPPPHYTWTVDTAKRQPVEGRSRRAQRLGGAPSSQRIIQPRQDSQLRDHDNLARRMPRRGRHRRLGESFDRSSHGAHRAAVKRHPPRRTRSGWSTCRTLQGAPTSMRQDPAGCGNVALSVIDPELTRRKELRSKSYKKV